MQFIPNGPDIPEELLQAQEKGKVIFFVGAGVSMPAGLPSFEGLVTDMAKEKGEVFNDEELKLFKNGEYDKVIGLYENRFTGGRESVRASIPKLLKFKKESKYLRTHLALLALATRRDKSMQLVTTNFDDLFQVVAEKNKLSLTTYPDVPSRPSWSGLVHLHGFLPKEPSAGDLDHLVLSEADFGQAYVYHGWAARFVADLFKNYTVCFVGYSVNDPVMRYMTAAFSQEKKNKKSNVFAFASFSSTTDGDKVAVEKAWQNKYIDKPILYDEADGHEALNKTLQIWANVYRHNQNKDLAGKKRMIKRYAHRLPEDSTTENNFVGRMLWALSDDSNRTVAYFISTKPPAYEWLNPILESKLFIQEGDLWGWLSQHLDKPDLIYKVANGELVLPKIQAQIRKQLQETTMDSKLRILWELLLVDKVTTSQTRDINYYYWQESAFRTWGSTKPLPLSQRLAFRQYFAPKIQIDRDLEIKLDFKESYVGRIDIHHESFKKALPFLVEDFQQLLLDALELMNAVAMNVDRKSIRLSCIASYEHDNYYKYEKWFILIVVLRDAWLAVLAQDKAKARVIAQSWLELPYVLFKRLALFAASHSDCIDPKQWLDWLLVDDFLWRFEIKREVCRLLVLQAKNLTSELQKNLETVLLQHTQPENNDLNNYYCALYLDKLKEGGLTLGEDAAAWLTDAIQKQWYSREDYKSEKSDGIRPFTQEDWPNFYPQMKTYPVDKEGLVVWLQHEHDLVKEITPINQHWRTCCSDSFDVSFGALQELAQQNSWPIHFWKIALGKWSSLPVGMFWPKLAPMLKQMPNREFKALAGEVTALLYDFFIKIKGLRSCLQDDLLHLLQRLIDLQPNSEFSQGDFFVDSYFSPIGKSTQVLIALHQDLNQSASTEKQRSRELIQTLLTKLCNTEILAFRPARLVIAHECNSLFNVDEAWTETHLVPLFSWDNSPEAVSAWTGFFNNNYFNLSLLKCKQFKSAFLACGAPENYDEFDLEHKNRFIKFMMFSVVPSTDEANGILDSETIRPIMSRLPVEALEQAAFYLWTTTKDNKEEPAYWTTCLFPFWQKCWPKGKDKLSPTISAHLAGLLTFCGEDFPAAFETLKPWLQAFDQKESRLHDQHYFIQDLYESNLCEKFPEPSWELLKIVKVNLQSYSPKEFKDCLEQIAQVWTEVKNELQYIQYMNDLKFK
jgi:hypothetical protein